jgi:hypothetical protein
MEEKYNYNHLDFHIIKSDLARFGRANGKSEIQENNKKNYVLHAEKIKNSLMKIKNHLKETIESRRKKGLPCFNEINIPILLEMIPEQYNSQTLTKYFDLELISEGTEQIILASSNDSEFSTFEKKIHQFGNQERGGSSVANLIGVKDNPIDRQKYILGEEFYQEISSLDNQDHIIVEALIEVRGNSKVYDEPQASDYKTNKTYRKALENWLSLFPQVPAIPEIPKDFKNNEIFERQISDLTLPLKREYYSQMGLNRFTEFEEFIKSYESEILDIMEGQEILTANNVEEIQRIHFEDTTTMIFKITLQGLKDLIINCPFLCQIRKKEIIRFSKPDDTNLLDKYANSEIIPPRDDAPIICIIDSGVQEQNILLNKAIRTGESYSFLGSENSTSDEHGHGTSVAGNALYHNISEALSRESIQLSAWIQNAKVLNQDNSIPEHLCLDKIIKSVVERYYEQYGTRIYNHSINSKSPFETDLMSPWANQIDLLCFQYDINIVQSAGNIPTFHDADTSSSHEVSISNFIFRERLDYPQYLLELACRVRDPAQSLNAISVGSLNPFDFQHDKLEKISSRNMISSFSPTGLGLWRAIKPDVVEFVGDYAKNSELQSLSVNSNLCSPTLKKIDANNLNLIGHNDLGTSFAAPKVAHVLSKIESSYPDSPALLHRGLLIHSATWPSWAKNYPKDQIFRMIGYGIPSESIALKNNDYRATFITPKVVGLNPKHAHIYKIAIPGELREVEDDYNVRITVTLSYVSLSRRTRKKRAYLSSWLDWQMSYLDSNESISQFENRIIKQTVVEDSNQKKMTKNGTYKWFLGNDAKEGMVKEFGRNNSTVQKDWIDVRSCHLPEEIFIAIRSHSGWDEKLRFDSKYALVVSIEFIDQNLKIYQAIKSKNSIKTKSRIR